jgi:hypothetical protein
MPRRIYGKSRGDGIFTPAASKESKLNNRSLQNSTATNWTLRLSITVHTSESKAPDSHLNPGR